MKHKLTQQERKRIKDKPIQEATLQEWIEYLPEFALTEAYHLMALARLRWERWQRDREEKAT